MKGMKHDPVTHPGRMKYMDPPCVKTGGPEAWGSMPMKAKGIPGKYSYRGMGPKSLGPTGKSPTPKV